MSEHKNPYEISIIAPCFNEMENVKALVSRINNVFQNRNINGEIILINDASTDNTGNLINELAHENKNVTAVHHEKNKGITEGWRTGLSHSKGRYICLIDSDLQNLPEDIWKLYKEIKIASADVIQGNRSTIGRLKDDRYIYSRVLNFILNIIFGMSLKDNKSGFIITYKNTLEDILQHRFNYYYANTFIAVEFMQKDIL